MESNIDKELSKKYCPRFAQLAVELNFVTPEQVKEALAEQLDEYKYCGFESVRGYPVS